jgi:ammonium transporter, Amt family
MQHVKCKMPNVIRFIALFAFTVMATASAMAAGTTKEVPLQINSGDTSWMLVSSALVLLMTPGLAFFYGGLVRRKNILNIFMQCFIAAAIISLQWIVCGYSLAFSPGNGFIGGLSYAFLNGVGLAPGPYAATIPHLLFAIFQMMFAIITPALIIGAFAERMKFSAYVIFCLLWATLVYDPLCHWVWGKGGWLAARGVVDFAGGIVVHISAGFAALVTALIVGKRQNGSSGMTPHNLPFTVLGAALLWFGWFGFNAGSALAANGTAVSAFMATNTGAAAAAVTWAVIEWFVLKKPTMLGTVTGAVAGLATVTPASGFVTPLAAMFIGITTAFVCYAFVSVVKQRFGYDDTLDAFGVHGIGGLWGTILTGIFATTAVNPGGVNGMIHGNPAQLGIQAFGAFTAVVYVSAATFAIYKLIDVLIGVRVEEKNELIGLDKSEHHESAYTLIE